MEHAGRALYPAFLLDRPHLCVCVCVCRRTFSGYIRGYENELDYNKSNREVLKLANIVVQLLNFLQLRFTLSLFLVSQISVVINVLKKHLGLM